MPSKDPRFPGAVITTLLIALILSIIPMGSYLESWRPEWMALTLVHWGLILHDRVSLFMAFCAGLIMDALLGSLLGQHALGYVLVTYLSVRLGLRMTPDAFLQQITLLIASLGIYMLINLWILRVTGISPLGGWLYWAPLISSVIIWPVYRALLGYFHVQRKAL